MQTMAKAPENDWYFRDWMTHLRKKQADAVRELGWNKSKASLVWNSQQPYSRPLVNEVSRWLQIRPYELLMPPAEALSLRRLRQTAAAIVADQDEAQYVHDDPSAERSRSTVGAR